MTDAVTREIFGNIDPLPRAVFYALAFASIACFAVGVRRRILRWRLGRLSPDRIDWSRATRRFVSLVLTQRALQGTRFAASLAHAALFSGFVLLLFGTILVAIEHYSATMLGRAHDHPLFHKGWYFIVFEITLEVAGILLLVGSCWFIVRRARGKSSMARQISDWIVLAALVLLCVSGFVLEGARIVREQTPLSGISFVGYGFAQLLELFGFSDSSVAGFHKVVWWAHGGAALALIAGLPYCRLLHLIAGSISIATTRSELGQMQPVSLEEVEQTGRVGAGQIADFYRSQLCRLDACVSCGRCEDACPAFSVGKQLSPRDVVQDLRRQMDVVYVSCAGENDNPRPPLPGNVIVDETLWSCTTCSACVDVCPLEVAPLGFITDMRRFVIGEGQFRGSAATALQKMQRSGNPWGLPREDRFAWAQGLDVPTVEDNPNFEILYWVGCAAAYDRRIQKVAPAVVQLLAMAGVNYACLGAKEGCTGESARRMGDEFLFQELAATNIETLAEHGVRRIVTHCPHCLNSFRHDYPQFGGHYEVVHHSQFLADLVAAGRLRVNAAQARRITYHDPCYLARVHGIEDAPRQIIQASHHDSLIELPRHRRQTACCGAGGGRMWFDDGPDQRVGSDRVSEVMAAGAEIVGVSCPFCLTMIQDGISATPESTMEVRDVAELLILATSTAATA